jgi:hypothetical protein
MDIKAGVNTAVFLAVLGLLISLWIGIQSIRSGRKLMYFRLRQRRVTYGWRMLGFALGLAVFAYLTGRYGEPAAYLFYEPSPTPTLTPTITLTPTLTLVPTITLTPTITDTPSITDTPTVTPTPSIPENIGQQFTSLVTPNPGALFSPLVFAREIDLTTYAPVEPGTVFSNPIRRIVAIYSFDGMNTGVQWTVLWYRNGELIYSETSPWKDTTGGYGFAERIAAPDEWQPGEYEVQIFVGLDWKSVGRFVVEGVVPTSTATRLPTATITETATPLPRPSATSTSTRPPTLTLAPTSTVPPTMTRRPTLTLRPSDTPWPSPTRVP